MTDTNTSAAHQQISSAMRVTTTAAVVLCSMAEQEIGFEDSYF
jgi:hypothetical protein